MVRFKLQKKQVFLSVKRKNKRRKRKEKMTIKQFLYQFYQTISFQKGQTFQAEKFQEFFLPEAALIEEFQMKYTKTTVSAYIREFQSICMEYPDYFVNGFEEKLISYEVIESENAYLVASRYEKRYQRDGQEVIEYGTNNFIIVQVKESFKIAQVLW